LLGSYKRRNVVFVANELSEAAWLLELQYQIIKLFSNLEGSLLLAMKCLEYQALWMPWKTCQWAGSKHSLLTI